MKFSQILAVAGVTLCLSGCFTLDTATMKWSGEEHVMANNYGWTLFNWIPLFCGNAADDAECGFVMFRDDVTPEKVQHRVIKYAEGRQLMCPAYHTKDTVFLNVLGIPIPYVICYKEITLSGTLK